jgi:hypothetical protein
VTGVSTVLAAPAGRGDAVLKPKPKRAPPQKLPRALNETLSNHDDRVYTFAEWCALNSISKSTGVRILKGEHGDRPEVTWLSPKRKGITVRSNREWQQRRARGA